MSSKLSALLCCLLMAYASLYYYPRWQKEQTEAAISWDVAGYYWYLPSVFIYHDLKHQSFADSVFQKYRPSSEPQQGFRDERSGNYVMKYSSGMAVMYTPFFLTAHLLARPLGYPADGFSAPYQLAIQIGGLLVSFLGLWLLRRFLKYYYDDKVVALVLFLLVFGSNYLNWAAIDTGLSHTWLFTLYTVLLLQTRRFYLRPSYGGALAIGLLVGLAGLTRPTDLLSVLIPLLWGLESLSRQAIREKLKFFRQQLRALMLAVAGAAIVLSIQLCYWKYATGRWLVYSYKDQGFSFLHPHFREYTFDYSTGWLIYAPVMIFAVIGILPFLRHGRNKVMVVAFSVINYYIVASWDVWWYGSRAMIQSYPVLCLLLAAFIAASFRRKWLLAVCAPCFVLAVYHNFWFTWFAHPGRLAPGVEQTAGLYDGNSMSEQYFLRVVGRWTTPSPDIWKLKDTRYIFEGTPRQPQLVYQNSFEGDTAGTTTEAPVSGVRSLLLDTAHRESPHYVFPVADRSAGWLRAEAVFHSTHKEWDVWQMAEWHLDLWSGGKPVTAELIRLHRDLDDWATKRIHFDVRIPRGGIDSAAVWFKAGSGKRLLVDELKVWSFRE